MLLVFAAALVIKLHYFKVKLLFSCAASDVLSTTKTLSCKLMNLDIYCKLVIFYLCAISVLT